MKFYSFIFLCVIFFTSCNDRPIIDDDGDDFLAPRTIQIPITCEKFNNTTDWVYCDMADFKINRNVGAIRLNVSFRNQRGTNSVCYAELYSVSKKEPIPFSNVESEIEYELHTVSSENLADILEDYNNQQLTIRFRNTGENSVSYVSNNSKLVIFY